MYSDETPHLFWPDLGHQLGESESIVECREFSLADLRTMIADNVIQDANMLALFARLSANRLIP